MADTKALELILESMKILKNIDVPPDDYSQKTTESYVNQCAMILDSTIATTTKVTSYMQSVKDKLNELNKILNNSFKMLQEAMAKALKRLKESKYRCNNQAATLCASVGQEIENANQTRNGQSEAYQIINGSPNKTEKQLESSEKQIQLLQNLAKQIGSLQEFIAQSNTCFETDFTVSDIEDLEGRLKDWIRDTENTFKEEKAEENERLKREAEEEQRRKQESERLQREAEKKKIQEEEEERLKHEAEQRKIKKEEERNKAEDERLKREAELRSKQEEEKRRKEDLERLQREAERKQRQEEEEERLRHEAEQRKIKEEEERNKAEDERLKREAELRSKQEEEKRRKEDLERLQREAERKQRQEEEEERLRHEAEQKKMQEEEERQKEEERKLKREAERKQRQEEEEERLRHEAEQKKMKEEEERQKEEERKLKREEEEKQRLIEEERQYRVDPINWQFLVYNDAVDDKKTHHDGVCCVVTAQDDGIERRDLNCSIAQEVDHSSDDITEDDEKIASSIITVDSVNGIVNLEAPMQVFIPHVDIDEDEDELIIKSSIDGGPWVEDTPTCPAKPVQGMDTKQMSRLAGKKLNAFKTAKLVAVSRPKLDKFTMGEVGGRIKLPSDDTISITVPQGSFERETVVRTQVVPVNDDMMESINKGSSSASSIIYVHCAQPPAKPLTVDITRQNDIENPSKTSYPLVKVETGQWKFADTITCGKTTTVKLPMGKQRFCIIEVGLLQEEQCQVALDVASAVYTRTTFTPARLIIKQNQADPSSGIIQCVRSKEVDSTLRYLLSKGYGIGPNVSREVYIREGTHIEATCIRNLLFITEDQAKKNTICFYANWGCSEEVSFGIKSKYFQRDYSCFSGDVISTFHGNSDPNKQSDCDLTITHIITLPKAGSIPTRIFGNMPLETIALTNCLSFLLNNKCSHHWQVILSNLCGGSKLRTVKREAGRESGSQSFDHQHLCKLVISDWIKSKPAHFNKFAAVKYALESSGYSTLVEPFTLYMDLFKEQMSDEVIKAVAASVTKDISDVIEDLDLTDDESKEFLDEYHDETRGQIEALIYGWRFTNNAIGAGSNALDLLKRILGLTS